MNDFKDLYKTLEEHEQSYRKGTLTLFDGVEFSQYQTIRQAGFFILSKYLSGQKDELGRLKPFRQLSNAVVDIEFRAKNIDRSHIRYKSDDGDYMFSLVVAKELLEWMDDNDFGTFIDTYQRKKSEFGTAVAKVTKKGKDLFFDVVEWQNLYVDPKNMKDGIKLEKHEMSELDFEQMKGTWDSDQIDAALKKFKREKKGEIGKKIEIWDAEGQFPASYVGDEGDKVSLYNIILAVVGQKKFLVHYAKLKQPRFYVGRPRKKIEGRDLGYGVVEELFEPQIWLNEAVIAEKFAMDLGGKVVVATNKKSPIPSALQLMDGEIIEVDKEAGEYFDPVALAAGVNFPEFQNVIDNWLQHTQTDQSIPDSLRGEQSSAPFAAQALQSAQASSIFNKRRDNDAYDIIDLIMEYLLPHIASRISQEHTLTVSLSTAERQQFDQVVHQARTAMQHKDALLNAPIQDIAQKGIGALMQEPQPLTHATNERKIPVPEGYVTMEKIRAKGRLYITSEQSDDQNRVSVLISQLQALAPNDPARAKILDQIMELSGVSPAQFDLGKATGSGQAPPNPQSQGQTQQIIKNALPQGQ